jgi:hypothetical protein
MQEQPATEFIVPIGEYRELVERYDERTLTAAFIGRWASREAFGLELLDDTSARACMAALPRWLRDYVRLDAEAFVADLERSGIYVVAPVDSGVCVFDAATVRPRP